MICLLNFVFFFCCKFLFVYYLQIHLMIDNVGWLFLVKFMKQVCTLIFLIYILVFFIFIILGLTDIQNIINIRILHTSMLCTISDLFSFFKIFESHEKYLAQQKKKRESERYVEYKY